MSKAAKLVAFTRINGSLKSRSVILSQEGLQEEADARYTAYMGDSPDADAAPPVITEEMFMQYVQETAYRIASEPMAISPNGPEGLIVVPHPDYVEVSVGASALGLTTPVASNVIQMPTN